MWVFNWLPGIPNFGLFLTLEILVSLVFIWWCYIDQQRWI